MKTLTLQWTQKQFEKLYNHIGIKDKDKNKIPQEVETRVYVLDQNTHDCFVNELSDKKFITLAERDGRVYTLQGFQEAFNLEEINSSFDNIRFINITI